MTELQKYKRMGMTVFLGIICLLVITCASLFVFSERHTVNAETVTDSALTAEELAMSVGLHGDAVGGDHVHEGAKELPTTDAEMSGGMYYLAQDTTIKDMMFIESGEEVILCLNGHKLKTENIGAFFRVLGGSLTIYDCEGGGSMTHNANNCIYIGAGGSVTMNGGVICDSGTTGNQGGGIYVPAGTFTMNGGVIKNNTAREGGGIYSVNSSIEINRGIIRGNTATRGGGVYIYNGATLNVGGTAVIQGNHNDQQKNSNVQFYNKTSKLNINAPIEDGFDIGITVSDKTYTGIVTSGYKTIGALDPTAKVCITSDTDDKVIAASLSGDELVLVNNNTWTSPLQADQVVDWLDVFIPTATAKYGKVEYSYSDREDGEFVPEHPTDIGNYWVKAYVPRTDTYTGLEATVNFAIAVNLNVWTTSLKTGEFIYATEIIAPTGAAAKYGKVEYSYSNSENGEFVAKQPTNAGVHWIKAYVPRTEEYSGLETKVRYEILPKTLTSSMVGQVEGTFTYSGERYTPTVTVSDDDLLTAGDYTFVYGENTKAGEGTVTVTAKGNYSGTVTRKFMITPAAIEANATGYNGVYDGNGHLTDTQTAITQGNQPAIWTYSDALNGTFTEQMQYTEVGIYTVYYIVSAPNHDEASGSFEVVITPAIIEINVTGYNGIYDGNEHDASESQTGITQGNQPASWMYSDAPNNTYTEQMPQYTEVGRYTVYYKVSAPNHNEASGSFKVSITPAAIEVSVTGYNGIYDGNEHDASESQTAITQGDQPASWTYATTQSGDYTDQMPQYTEAGRYTVYYKVSAPSHNEVSGSYEVTIMPEEIDVSVYGYEGTYDGEPHEAIAQCSAETVFHAATWTYAESANEDYTEVMPQYRNAGTYTVYYKVSAQSHEDAYGTFTVTIAKRSVTVTIGHKTGVYGEELKELTYALEDGALASWDTAEVLNIKLTKATGLDAGTYAITGGYYSANYTVEFIDGKYTIEKATYVTTDLTFGGKTVTYNGQLHSLAVSGLPAGVEVTYTNNGKINAGTYEVTATFKGDANYNEIANMTATLTINKAVYDMSGVTFGNKTVQADGNAQSVTISGTLPDGVTVTYVGNGKTEAGEYTVTAKFGGDAENYEAIPDKTAKLTITPAPEPEPEPEKGGCGGVVLDGMTVAGITLAVFAFAVALAVRKAKKNK